MPELKIKLDFPFALVSLPVIIFELLALIEGGILGAIQNLFFLFCISILALFNFIPFIGIIIYCCITFMFFLPWFHSIALVALPVTETLEIVIVTGIGILICLFASLAAIPTDA